MIEDVLTAQNRWLLANLDKLEAAIIQARIPAELVPYQTWMQQVCQKLRSDILQNLSDVQIGLGAITADILSNTQAATEIR